MLLDGIFVSFSDLFLQLLSIDKLTKFELVTWQFGMNSYDLVLYQMLLVHSLTYS